jgi:hypothetical protein
MAVLSLKFQMGADWAFMKIKNSSDVSGMCSTAHFSDDEVYRYYLEWSWIDAPLLTVCMLNPSTATHEVLDPTIKGLMKRANLWGYGGVAVVNLFAFRSPSPSIMKAAADPVGPENDAALLRVSRCLGKNSQMVAAWGNHGKFKQRDSEVLALFRGQLAIFDLNSNGTPKHPLYVLHSLRLSSWQSCH